MSNLLRHLQTYVNWLSDSYRPNPTALGVLRIAFAAHVLLFPVDYTWVRRVPNALFTPPPGPIAVLDTIPSEWAILTLQIAQAALAVLVLVGIGTKITSTALSIVLVVGNGIVFSFNKVDHTILYALLPLALGFIGWGATLSVDRLIRHRVARTDGFIVLLWGLTVAFAMFTAAYPKVLTGWLSPAREATREFVVRDISDGVQVGLLAEFMTSLDIPFFWKFMDWATIFAEGWLILAVFFPPLFRIGLFIMAAFHVGVYLTLAIDYFSYLFVYAVFLFRRPSTWFSGLPFAHRRRKRTDQLAPVGSTFQTT